MATDNAERMQHTDDAWNGRDWDAFDRFTTLSAFFTGPAGKRTRPMVAKTIEPRRSHSATRSLTTRSRISPMTSCSVRVISRASSHGSLARSVPH
jgi:hypothetical protein